MAYDPKDNEYELRDGVLYEYPAAYRNRDNDWISMHSVEGYISHLKSGHRLSHKESFLVAKMIELLQNAHLKDIP